MSDREIIRSPRAERDVDEIVAYLDSVRPEAADRFLDRLGTLVELLSRQPGLGPLRKEFGPEIRVALVRGFAHVVFYRETDDGIAIVRVIDGRRNLPERFRDDR